LALFVYLVLYFVGLGSFACAISEAKDCDNVPMIRIASLVLAPIWLVLFVATLTLPVFRYGPNARSWAWLSGPPILTLGFIAVILHH
jgi:amino acid transporter